MTFNNVNFATISISREESLALQKAVQFVKELEQTLESHHVDSILRADTQEVIKRDELRRVRGILTGFYEPVTYWHQYTNMEEE